MIHFEIISPVDRVFGLSGVFMPDCYSDLMVCTPSLGCSPLSSHPHHNSQHSRSRCVYLVVMGIEALV
jgi:hypothetical protein